MSEPALATLHALSLTDRMNQDASNLEKNQDWLQKAYPGIYILNLNVYPDLKTDITHMQKQVDTVASVVRTHTQPALRGSPCGAYRSGRTRR